MDGEGVVVGLVAIHNSASSCHSCHIFIVWDHHHALIPCCHCLVVIWYCCGVFIACHCCMWLSCTIQQMMTNIIVCHSVPGVSELSGDELKTGGAHCAVALSCIVWCHLCSRQHGTCFPYGFPVCIHVCSFWGICHCLGGHPCCLGSCGSEAVVGCHWHWASCHGSCGVVLIQWVIWQSS